MGPKHHSTGRARPLALSPSRANDYQQCPLLYRFRAIDKLYEPKTVAQVKGTLVHAVLEKMYSWPRAQRELAPAVKLLKPTWAQMCADDPELAQLVAEPDLLGFLVECRELLKGYFRMENPQGFDADATEKYVTTTLDGGVPVRGFIDRVDIAPTGEIRVVDYKTGKKPPRRFSQQAFFQMRFYALVYWRLYGRIPDQLRLMYLKVMDSLYLSPSPQELEYFERDLASLWARIVADGESGNFKPTTSKLCGWCSFQDICPAFGGTAPEYPGWPGQAQPPAA
ncbi:exodeoxyribonuclease V subunit beta [Corynebacterium atypicum]|uniref:Exodeoxyribonuclease V subunit beta n=1 Tax=Corynebacterium atypicum TaxID=191610 RepID=A0ABN4DFK7_9CORY|nr:exodeoxyribonuclease V subunit beta [Corynebacterium atypicum]